MIFSYQTTGVQTVEYPYEINMRESQAMDNLIRVYRDQGLADVLIVGNYPIDTVVMNHENYGALVLKYGEFYDYVNENYPEVLL